MLAIAHSGALVGVLATPVQVEVNTGEAGEIRYHLVGLPDTAVKESQNRVYSAIGNTGYKPPQTRTTINLAPGDVRKEGSMYDLPIALGMLVATNQLRTEHLKDYIIAGELSLSGSVRPVRGGLALGLLARKMKKKGVLLPPVSAEEAALVEGIPVYSVGSLQQAVEFLAGNLQLTRIRTEDSSFHQNTGPAYPFDFSEVKGQQPVRRAVEIAVAGRHNIIMAGSPGSGKSMMAKRIPSIMPRPSLEEYQEILSIQSAAGVTLRGEQSHFQRPFRAPHHTISDVGLLGGGSNPGPGEISLAHQGVLFLDELPEFRRSTLEVLRQPLEDGKVTISRSAGKVTLPCSFMLVAAMNPCPCGYMGDPKRECRCSPTAVQRYRSRISGPLLDRIDIHIEAPALSFGELRSEAPGESSASMLERIHQARSLQAARGKENALLGQAEIRKYCSITRQQGDLLQSAMEELHLSARAYDRILKVARTIADLAGTETISNKHLLEAIQYRSLDRRLFY